MRASACFILEHLLLAVGPSLTHEQRRLVYPELLKRLDDSNNGVRVAVSGRVGGWMDTWAGG